MLAKFLPLLIAFSLHADCIRGYTSHLELRHREPEGIGYSTGYSTAQGFLTPNWQRRYQPFLDARAHIFNDGRVATNIGIGSRFAPSDRWIFGLNTFYDFRDAKRLRSHQIGVGLEALHPWIDIYLNGYIPTRTNARSTPFLVSFSDARVTRHSAAALANIMLEIGAPFYAGPVDIYSSLGPYYLAKRRAGLSRCGGTLGAIGRLSLRLYDGIDIGGEMSYDKEFKTRANGYLSFSLPYGPNTVTRQGNRWKRWYSSECDAKASLQRRMTQPVHRQEIIPICEKKESLSFAAAISQNIIPDCLFVDSNAAPGGDGSITNPFNDLATAIAAAVAGDCIYVFDRGLNYPLAAAPGTQLPENVTLVGSGINFSFNGAIFPAQTATLPGVTGVLAPNIDDTIAGMRFIGSGNGGFPFDGIIGSGIAYSGLLITQNSFIDAADIQLFSAAGATSTTIVSNTFTNPGATIQTMLIIGIDTLSLINNSWFNYQMTFVAPTTYIYRDNTHTNTMLGAVHAPISMSGTALIHNNTISSLGACFDGGGSGATRITSNSFSSTMSLSSTYESTGVTGTVDFRNNISNSTNNFDVSTTMCLRITGNAGPLIDFGVDGGDTINVDGDPVLDNPAITSVTTTGAGTVNTNTNCF